MRSVPFAVALFVPLAWNAHLTARGATLALISGGLPSGVGYSFWYGARPSCWHATHIRGALPHSARRTAAAPSS